MSAAPLLSAQELTKEIGGKPLFEGISFSIEEREKLALIGPNGSGKSTLLRLIASREHPDSGIIRARSGLRCAYVAQEDIFDEQLTIAETLEKALVAAGRSEHEVAGTISRLCGRVGFSDRNAVVNTLSGGWRKRLAIARGVIVDPELLLLDEPTNHLDIDGVLWLEEFLAGSPFAIFFVSHDRYFIERLASRVFEINRQYPRGFYSADGAYADFLEARAAYLLGLQQTKDSLANRVRREVAWLRQGAKARTTKSKHRIAEAGRMMEELRSFRLDENRADIEFASSNRKTRELIKLDQVEKQMGGRTLFKDISLVLSPGVRLGVVGPNGSGKTTFLRMLVGELKPDSGRVIRANNLRIAFFDQARKQLDPSVTLKAALCTDGDRVVFKDKLIHVAGWAERFLFTRDHLSARVGDLSGGEQARVLLAKIMLEETDVLMFDEPTNDLDIKTLEVLEESFCEYPGALVLITHDRYLLDRTATTVLAIGERANGMFGDYLQWERALRESESELPSVRKNATAPGPSETPPEKTRTKLSFNEQRELDGIEKQILKAEDLVEKLKIECSSEAVLADPAALREACKQLADQQTAVESLYSRWEELEELKRKFREAKKE